MARTSKLTKAVRAAICRDLAAGLTRAAAAARAGITPRTLSLWLKRGRDDPDERSAVAAFARAVAKAEQDAVARDVSLVQTAAADDWRAAAWWLEHRFPEDWAVNRRELADLRRQLAALLKRKVGQTHVEGRRLVSDGAVAAHPGGDARPPG